MMSKYKEAKEWFEQIYSDIKGAGYADENEEAYEVAIKALDQIEEITKIINVRGIQENIMKYQIICDILSNDMDEEENEDEEFYTSNSGDREHKEASE